ncbi:MAG: ATP-binding protein [Succiniclasticum sp.]|jgi:anti-sigma regulatory factor (Ser/Thr protein kinase)
MNNNTEQGWKRYDADMKWFEHIREDVVAAAEEAGVSPRQQLKLELGFEEILVNIISYAYDDPGYVWVRTTEGDNDFRIEFADHGKPFDPLEKDRRPAEDTPLEDREPGGYGIFLVKQNFKSVEYKYEEMFGHMANHMSMLLDKG